jgi:hypothetical protein
MADEVTVSLKNPPSGATMWQLVLCDWDITVAIHQIGGLARLDVAEPITFEIPNGVQFPLRVVSLQITKWNEARTALIALYEIQSFRPYLYDFEAMEWSDIPDPTYRELFIPDLGSYYFNVATEALYEAIPALALWPLAVIGGLGILGVGATIVYATTRGEHNPGIGTVVATATALRQFEEEEKRKKEKARPKGLRW